MTQPNITPQGFRTATYVETKARIDAARSRTGKTSRQVTCTPPNVKCGGRCIPPNWDCRLQGKGPDPHLRAVRTDPVGGLANIERGVKRIAKGVRKGSFSEIEGGKRAIVRGVVKATPGDIQRKKKLQAKLERHAATVAAGLAVVGFGLFSHNQLKRVPFYRDGVGREVDEAVAAGINRVLDVIPGIRGARVEGRAAGRAAAADVIARTTGTAARGPKALSEAVLLGPTQLERRATEYGNAKVLENKIKALDISAKTLDDNITGWRQKSLETFWGTKRTNAAGAGDGSTFSEPATHEYLSRQFGFNLSKGSDATYVRRSVATALSREARNLQVLARQQGVDLKNGEARSAFLNRLVGPSTANFPDDVRERAVNNLDKILGDAPRTKGASVSRKNLADKIYSDTRNGFDTYFGRIADEVRQTPGAALSPEARRAGYSDLLNSARIGHSRYLAKSLGKSQTIDSRMQEGLSNLVAKEYYARRVMEVPTFTATDLEIRLAATELSGRTISTTTEGLAYLRSNGFDRLTTLRGPETRVRATAPKPDRPKRPARRRSIAQQIADLMRQKNPDGTPRYATREAAEAELKRRRKDELQQARVDAYLAVREDLRGKPCGASHIPKAHECRKGAGAAPTKASSERDVTSDRLRAAATGALVAGLAAGGTASFRNRQNLAMGAIRGLSSEQIQKGLAKVPSRFKEPVRNLVGRTKTSVAGVLMVSKGSKLVDVDNANNMATFSLRNGDLVSVSNVGDALVMFRTHPNNTIDYGGGETAGRYVVDFTVDLLHKQSKQDRKQALGIARKTKTMFTKQMSYIPDNSFVTAKAYSSDGLGNKRGSIYQKYGFQPIGEISTHLWGIKAKGEFRKMNESQINSLGSILREQERVDSPEADRIIARRQRTDALPLGLIRATTYLAVRADLRDAAGSGKPCGASHIPKAHTCTKGEGRTVAQQQKREAVPQDKELKQLSAIEKEMDRERDGKKSLNSSSKVNKKAVAAVLAIGATAATGAYVIQDMKRVAKEPNMFAPSPSTRTIAKAAKKEFDTKKSGTAMGNYYTNKSGLKPGDVVYYRNEKDPAAHFGIYLGEGKDGKVRAVMANTNEKRASFVDVMELGTTKPDSNDAAHFMFPVLQKAPPLKGAKARTNEETVRRALRAVGTDYKFSLTRDNCEVLANSIAYDAPRSQQLERFKLVTRRVADNTIGMRQRAGMAMRRARGQRKTKALTSSQILERLSKDDNSFITQEGKKLALSHYNQFFESTTKFDAAAAMPAGLITPEKLWDRIETYDDDKKAIAMRDYLLVLRLALAT